MKNLSLSILLFFFVNTIIGQNIPEKPTSYQSVVDEASLLSTEEKKALSAKLDAFEKETGNELVVVTVNSLNGYSVEKYANKLFNTWGIGKKAEDNGVLILVSKSERKMKIETGYGVEGVLTDTECAKIIDFLMKPSFKNEKYYEGLKLASDYIVKDLSGQTETNFNELKNHTDINSFDLSESFVERRKDSITPWVSFFLGFFVQFVAGWLLIKKSAFVRKKNDLKENLEMSLFLVSLFYVILSFIISIITENEKLFYSTSNKLFGILTFSSVVIYLIQLLPKIVGTYTANFFRELFRLFFCIMAAMIFSLITLLFTESEYVFLAAVLILTIVFYYLSYTGKLDWLDSGGSSSSYSSSYRSSSSSYSDYSRSSYSDSSYGGGSSGGGGASGSW